MTFEALGLVSFRVFDTGYFLAEQIHVTFSNFTIYGYEAPPIDQTTLIAGAAVIRDETT